MQYQLDFCVVLELRWLSGQRELSWLGLVKEAESTQVNAQRVFTQVSRGADDDDLLVPFRAARRRLSDLSM